MIMVRKSKGLSDESIKSPATSDNSLIQNWILLIIIDFE